MIKQINIMKKNIFKTISIIVLSIILFSCSKEPGQGGSSTIKGKVYAKYYDKTFTVLQGEGYMPELDVYIIYGNDASFSDRTRTNYDGIYEFKYLRKGDYRVYVYSKDSTLTIPSGLYPVIADVKITENDQTVEVPNLNIFQ